jgi:hypothetical protein
MVGANAIHALVSVATGVDFGDVEDKSSIAATVAFPSTLHSYFFISVVDNRLNVKVRVFVSVVTETLSL